ncbi:MAG TPA: tetratricopeptide repeat protein, partial [bacterium]
LAVREMGLELGRAALREQAWERARAHFERVTTIDPQAAAAWRGLGDALAGLGQEEPSRRMYDRAKALEGAGEGTWAQ